MLDTRESYDEFLKLVNNFTQGMIDGRMLIEGAAGFLGESELMIKFREILGFDAGDAPPEASMSSVPLGWDRNMRAVQDLGYRSSYKKLTTPVGTPTTFAE
jgi:paired amphipathic helix protein Sin3a